MESLAQNFFTFLLIVGAILLPGILIVGGQWIIESMLKQNLEEQERKNRIPPLK